MRPSDQRSCVFAAVLQPLLVRWAQSCPTLISSQQARWPRVAAVSQPDGRRFNSPNSQFPKSPCPSGHKLLTCASVRVHPARAALRGEGGVAFKPWCFAARWLICSRTCLICPPRRCNQRPQLHAAAAVEIPPPRLGER